MIKSYEEYMSRGSGWKHKRVISLDLKIVHYKPFREKSYIKTPNYIPKRSVINVKNEDTCCFEWAILSALYPVKSKQHPYRPIKYQAHLN